MTTQPEQFSNDEQQVLGMLDFEHSDLKAWREAGSAWVRLLYMTHRSNTKEKQAIYTERLDMAAVAYVNSFVDMTNVVKTDGPSTDESVMLIDSLVALEDDRLIRSTNQLFHNEALTPLPPELRQQITLPFADPDSIVLTLENERLLSQEQKAAYITYLDELYLRAGLVLPNNRAANINPDKHRVSRKALGAVGVGSIIALNYFSKRKKS